jgi:hypothetical protein
MTRTIILRLLTGLAALATAPMAWSATASDWPCVQRKVPEISLAAIWPGPPLDAAAMNWRKDAAIADLVQRLAVRRTSESEAAAAIAGFAKASGSERAPRLLMLMAGLLETINAERAEVMAGLERFGDGQKQLAIVIRNENAKLSELRSDPQADPAMISERSEQLVWNLRIFEERQKSLSFVCEVPVLIEQRLFALAKEIHKALK